MYVAYSLTAIVVI